ARITCRHTILYIIPSSQCHQSTVSEFHDTSVNPSYASPLVGTFFEIKWKLIVCWIFPRPSTILTLKEYRFTRPFHFCRVAYLYQNPVLCNDARTDGLMCSLVFRTHKH